MNSHVASNPVSLSYIAALRGVKPRKPGEAFHYADAACTDTELLTCLAASNPEGQFYGVVDNAALQSSAMEQATLRDVSNVRFVTAQEAEKTLPSLNYLSMDESKIPLSAEARKKLFDLAATKLLPSGLFHYTYRAYGRDDGALRFLIRELAPEMNGDQAQEFLVELKKLGATYFAAHPDLLAKLEENIRNKTPDEFFSLFDEGSAPSGTFDTIIALNPRGFVYAGDSDIAANYVELSAPPESHDLIEKCRSHVLYEQIKDLVLARSVRSDIWCREPVTQTAATPELFGSFSYGIPMQRDDVPMEVIAKGKIINLASPLYSRLIDLLTLMPISIGDFLNHPTGQDHTPDEVVEALQVLVACGLAQPMRGAREVSDMTTVMQPRLLGGFNRYLDKLPVEGKDMWMSSPVLGGAISVSARDVLVMQALGRAGLANSVSALMPELERLAKNPAQAAKIMDTTEPTAEMAQTMIKDVVGKSIVQWYAYGLLEAA